MANIAKICSARRRVPVALCHLSCCQGIRKATEIEGDSCSSLQVDLTRTSHRLCPLTRNSYLHPSKTALTIPSAKYDELRSSLVNAELILLRVLKFELRLSTPFDYLEDLLRDYISYCKSDRAHYDDYTMVLDSMIGVVSRCNIHKA